MRQTEKDEFDFNLCSHVGFTTGELHNTGFTKTGPIKRQFVSLVQVVCLRCRKSAGVSKTAFRFEQRQLDVINSVRSRYITLDLLM